MKKENDNKIILDLCGGTGSWSKPYKDAGYTVVNITLPQYDILDFGISGDILLFKTKNTIENLGININRIYGVLCAPPCTMFSRARTTAKTPRDFEGAMKVVYACLKIIWIIQYKSHDNCIATRRA